MSGPAFTIGALEQVGPGGLLGRGIGGGIKPSTHNLRARPNIKLRVFDSAALLCHELGSPCGTFSGVLLFYPCFESCAAFCCYWLSIYRVQLSSFPNFR